MANKTHSAIASERMQWIHGRRYVFGYAGVRLKYNYVSRLRTENEGGTHAWIKYSGIQMGNFFLRFFFLFLRLLFSLDDALHGARLGGRSWAGIGRVGHSWRFVLHNQQIGICKGEGLNHFYGIKWKDFKHYDYEVTVGGRWEQPLRKRRTFVSEWKAPGNGGNLSAMLVMKSRRCQTWTAWQRHPTMCLPLMVPITEMRKANERHFHSVGNINSVRLVNTWLGLRRLWELGAISGGRSASWNS